MLGFIIPKTLLKHTDVIFYMTCITVKEFLKLKSQYPILISKATRQRFHTT